MITRRQLLRWMASLGIVGTAAAAYAVFIEPMSAPRITRYAFRPQRWPTDLDLTIAVLADIHACRPWMTPERIRSIVATTNDLGADLIVLLGDYVTGHRYVSEDVPASEWAKELGALRAPLGVHAVLGNHEWWDDPSAQRTGAGPTFGRVALEAVGIPVLENDVVRLNKAGKPFWLVGLGDQLAFLPSLRRYPDRRMGVDDLDGSLAKVTDDAPVILLAHEPDIAVRVPERVAVLLSGHTHGGQVRLFGWSPVVPSRYGNRYAYGHVRETCDIVVSGGLGCTIAPIRIGVPPEVVLLSLGRTGKAS
jgi:uncharacterized protein